MSVIRNVEVLDKDKLNVTKRKSKKTQILLYDTHRRSDDFINMIRYRKNGKYDDVPHFLVTKLGDIYQLYDTNHSSRTFGDSKTDRKMVKVAIENLGWLNKNTITGFLNNWIGDSYRSEPHIRNWRGHYFWDKYSDTQMESISELCDYICNKHEIFKQVVPSQGFLENVSNFKGIVCKSNFSNIYTDINPSFNFRTLFNYAKQTDIGV